LEIQFEAIFPILLLVKLFLQALSPLRFMKRLLGYFNFFIFIFISFYIHCFSVCLVLSDCGRNSCYCCCCANCQTI